MSFVEQCSPRSVSREQERPAQEVCELGEAPFPADAPSAPQAPAAAEAPGAAGEASPGSGHVGGQHGLAAAAMAGPTLLTSKATPGDASFRKEAVWQDLDSAVATQVCSQWAVDASKNVGRWAAEASGEFGKWTADAAGAAGQKVVAAGTVVGPKVAQFSSAAGQKALHVSGIIGQKAREASSVAGQRALHASSIAGQKALVATSVATQRALEVSSVVGQHALEASVSAGQRALVASSDVGKKVLAASDVAGQRALAASKVAGHQALEAAAASSRVASVKAADAMTALMRSANSACHELLDRILEMLQQYANRSLCDGSVHTSEVCTTAPEVSADSKSQSGGAPRAGCAPMPYGRPQVLRPLQVVPSLRGDNQQRIMASSHSFPSCLPAAYGAPVGGYYRPASHPPAAAVDPSIARWHVQAAPYLRHVQLAQPVVQPSFLLPRVEASRQVSR
mmetsp:Transcript_87463/g.283181  ORF Transcript_87463/g.283181 Transcript_87463/m.283181 type:complete len:452 (-) Transcript_87463:223-1578(-)